jgi:hypothetical protein
LALFDDQLNLNDDERERRFAIDANMPLPVLPSTPPLRLTPTDVSQFVRLDQCERFLRFRLAERAGQDFKAAPAALQRPKMTC